MKRSIVLVFSLLFCAILATHAQVQIMPEAGISILKEKDAAATVSPRIGIRLNYNFQGEQGWSVVSGLYFHQKRESYTTGALRASDSNGNYRDYPFIPGDKTAPVFQGEIDQVRIMDFDTKRDYLQMPIQGQYKWRLNEHYSLSVATGLYFAVGVGGKNKFKEATYSVADKTSSYAQGSGSTFDLLVYDRFDMGITSQAAIQVHRIVCHLGYEVNLYRPNSMGREHTVTMGIGYLF